MVVEHGSRCFMCPWILFLGVCPNPRNSFQPHRTYLSYSHSVNKYLPLFIRTRTLFRFNKSEFCFPGLARIFWRFYTLQVPRNTNKWVSSFRSVPRLKRTIGENLFRHDPAGDQKRNHGINNLLRKSHHLTSSSFRVRKLPSSTFSILRRTKSKHTTLVSENFQTTQTNPIRK